MPRPGRSSPAPPPVAVPAASPAWIAGRLQTTSAKSISSTLAELIRSGTLVPGTRLPTIRGLAGAAEVSIGTIADAWRVLRQAGLIETHRRGGTVVTGRSGLSRQARFDGWTAVDMVQCYPDPSLQPPLSGALIAGASAPDVNHGGRAYITESLRAAVEADWPFEAEDWNTSGGGTEGLLLATAAAAPPGSRILVEEPLPPGYRDVLTDLDLDPIGVAADADGPSPASLREGLRHLPAAVLFQHSGAFARSHRTTAERAAALAALLRDHREPGRDPVWVVEDDALGPLSPGPSVSLGAHLPGSVLHVRSYCKAFGLDLRTAVLGGARTLVSRSIALRSHGIASNSRILQNALAHLIKDPEAHRFSDVAWRRYTRRRSSFLAALRDHGLAADAAEHGLTVWVDVRDETRVLLALAARSIVVGAGSKAFVTPPASHGSIRASVMQFPDDPVRHQELAALIAAADTGELRDYFD